MTVKTPPELPADLAAGLRRLKLSTIRQLAPGLLLTAKTQRWTPEEILRTLVEAEVASRDASNTAARLKASTFPVTKTLEEFDVAASSIPPATWAYLTSLEWIPARENLALIGPAGTGKSHTLIALGHAAVHAGYKVKYAAAADLVETLYRGLADNSVGKTIETLLRHDLILVDEVGFAPLDDTGAQLLFRLVAAAYERRSLGNRLALVVRGLGPVPTRAHHRRQPPRPAPAPRHHRGHHRPVLPHGRRQNPGRRPPQHLTNTARGGDFHLATSGDLSTAIDTNSSVLDLERQLSVPPGGVGVSR